MHSKEIEVIKKLKNYLPKKYFEKDREILSGKIEYFIKSSITNLLEIKQVQFSSQKNTMENGVKINEFHLSAMEQREDGFTVITISYNKRKVDSISYINIQTKKNAINVRTTISYDYDKNVIELKKNIGVDNFIIKKNLNDSFDVVIKKEDETFKYNTLDQESQIQKELYCLTHDFIYINEIENSIEEMKKIVEKPVEMKLNYFFDKESGEFIVKQKIKRKLN